MAVPTTRFSELKYVEKFGEEPGKRRPHDARHFPLTQQQLPEGPLRPLFRPRQKRELIKEESPIDPLLSLRDL